MTPSHATMASHATMMAAAAAMYHHQLPHAAAMDYYQYQPSSSGHLWGGGAQTLMTGPPCVASAGSANSGAPVGAATAPVGKLKFLINYLDIRRHNFYYKNFEIIYIFC